MPYVYVLNQYKNIYISNQQNNILLDHYYARYYARVLLKKM